MSQIEQCKLDQQGAQPTPAEGELLPCPFCGRRMIRVGLHLPHWQQWWEHEDKDTSTCPVKSQIISGERYKAAWNTRALPAVEGELISREAAARLCEDLVMHDPEHGKWQTFQGDVCGWCGGLEKAAAMIRALPAAPAAEWRKSKES